MDTQTARYVAHVQDCAKQAWTRAFIIRDELANSAWSSRPAAKATWLAECIRWQEVSAIAYQQARQAMGIEPVLVMANSNSIVGMS